MSIGWIDVLRHFERKGYVGNGLTLPFLIGFPMVLYPGKPLQSIPSFIHEASSITSLHGITTFRCGNIGEYVFGSLDPETDKYRKSNKGVYQEFGNFLIVDDTLKHFQELNQVIREFDRRYAKYISAEQFSKVAGQWQFYTEIDQKRLRELLPSDDIGAGA